MTTNTSLILCFWVRKPVPRGMKNTQQSMELVASWPLN